MVRLAIGKRDQRACARDGISRYQHAPLFPKVSAAKAVAAVLVDPPCRGDPAGNVGQLLAEQATLHGPLRGTRRPPDRSRDGLPLLLRVRRSTTQPATSAPALEDIKDCAHSLYILEKSMRYGSIFLGMLLIAALQAGGCDDVNKSPNNEDGNQRLKENQRQKETEEEKEQRLALEHLRERENAKADLRASPSKYIKVETWRSANSGIVNDYTRITAITFTNHSQFDVSDIEGKVTLSDSANHELATVPFTVNGSVYAEATKALEVTSGEIRGAAATAKFAIEKVHVAQ
jgi:hypothetical protein